MLIEKLLSQLRHSDRDQSLYQKRKKKRQQKTADDWDSNKRETHHKAFSTVVNCGRRRFVILITHCTVLQKLLCLLEAQLFFTPRGNVITNVLRTMARRAESAVKAKHSSSLVLISVLFWHNWRSFLSCHLLIEFSRRINASSLERDTDRGGHYEAFSD